MQVLTHWFKQVTFWVMQSKHWLSGHPSYGPNDFLFFRTWRIDCEDNVFRHRKEWLIPSMHFCKRCLNQNGMRRFVLTLVYSPSWTIFWKAIKPLLSYSFSYRRHIPKYKKLPWYRSHINTCCRFFLHLQPQESTWINLKCFRKRTTANHQKTPNPSGEHVSLFSQLSRAISCHRNFGAQEPPGPLWPNV